MMLSIAFLGSMGGNAAGFLFPKFLQEAHHWSPGNVSSLFLFGGALGIMGSIFSGRLSDRYGRRVMGSSFLFLSPLMTIWMYTAPGWSIVPAWILETFFDIAAGTILNAYSAELFPTSYRSTAGSALAVAGTTGGALGLFFEGVLYNLHRLARASSLLPDRLLDNLADDHVVPAGDLGPRARRDLARGERDLISRGSSTR